MKLYKTDGAPAGERWHSAKTGLKDFTEVELPKDGRAGMALFLNGNEREVGSSAPLQSLDPLEAAELRAVRAATTMPQPPPAPSMTLTFVEEFIQGSDPAQLASIASNVCWRLKEMQDRIGRATQDMLTVGAAG